MAATRAELYRLGISAGGGARETARITRETDRYNQQLAEQERRLGRGRAPAQAECDQGQS